MRSVRVTTRETGTVRGTARRPHFSLAVISVTVQLRVEVFWVRSVYFNIRNILPKSGTFPLGHLYIYIYMYMCVYIYIYIYYKRHVVTRLFSASLLCLVDSVGKRSFTSSRKVAFDLPPHSDWSFGKLHLTLPDSGSVFACC